MKHYYYEAIEDNAGGIRLYIMDGEKRDLACIGHWEETPDGTLMDAIHELHDDPEAWKCWELMGQDDIMTDEELDEYDHARVAELLHEADAEARETRTIFDNAAGIWSIYPKACGAEGYGQLRITDDTAGEPRIDIYTD